ALHGFADRYLTDRPRYHCFIAVAKVMELFYLTKYFCLFLAQHSSIICFLGVFLLRLRIISSFITHPAQP
ncbi:MAG: hypothetical protein ACI4TW_00150, partial [Prevotella sp.]